MKDGKHLIVVVDDDRDVLEQFKVILNDGYKMVEALSGEEAAEVFMD